MVFCNRYQSAVSCLVAKRLADRPGQPLEAVESLGQCSLDRSGRYPAAKPEYAEGISRRSIDLQLGV